MLLYTVNNVAQLTLWPKHGKIQEQISANMYTGCCCCCTGIIMYSALMMCFIRCVVCNYTCVRTSSEMVLAAAAQARIYCQQNFSILLVLFTCVLYVDSNPMLSYVKLLVWAGICGISRGQPYTSAIVKMRLSC